MTDAARRADRGRCGVSPRRSGVPRASAHPAKLAAFAGNDDLAKQYNDNAKRLAMESRAQRLENAGKALLKAAGDRAGGLMSAKDARDKLNEARDLRRRIAAGDYEVEGEPIEERDPNLEEVP